MSLNKLKEEIAQKEKELVFLKDQLASKEITMKDIVPFAVFDIIPACRDIIVLIPNADGEFSMGGFNRDFKRFWDNSNRCNGKNSFTQSEMFDKLKRLNATKSVKKIAMV